jgi:hypothetical protein
MAGRRRRCVDESIDGLSLLRSASFGGQEMRIDPPSLYELRRIFG